MQLKHGASKHNDLALKKPKPQKPHLVLDSKIKTASD